MKRKNTTRNALVTSIISLLLCVSMLVGTTFAWFTDSVESGRNVIASGNLDVELLAGGTPVNSSTMLFKNIDGDLWEPGVVVYENFTVRNNGTLALKYNMNLAVLDETAIENNGTTYKFSDAIKVGIVDSHVSGDRNAVIAAVTNWTTLTNFSLNKSDVKMEAGAADEQFAVVLYWQPDVDYTDGNYDNIFNVEGGLKLEIGVNLYATQVEAESDTFGNDYDTNAKYSDSETTTAGADGSASLQAAVAPAEAADKQMTTVEAPAGAFNAADEVKIEVETTNTLFNISSAGAQVASLDVTMTVNGEKTTGQLTDSYYTVTTYISTGLADVEVYYGDVKHNSTYDPVTGKLEFTTDHFSLYTVTAKAYGYTGDTAYATAQEAAAAVDADTFVNIPDADMKAVAELVTKEDFKEEYALASWDDNYYLTVAEMNEAVKNYDATLKILRDFTLTETLTIPNGRTVTLNLNGNTITGIDNATGSFGLITNRGNLTITGNGKITLKATNDRDWNAYSSVLSNNPGGKLVIENGTFEHLGGSDMAYGIDNLTNGKGTYAETVINGGTVKSPYRAIRQFLNGIEAQNILTVNGGTIEGANKSIWMQDPSKNANTGKLTVSENAVLNGDVYLFVTAGSTEWPVTVSIAADALAEGSEVLTGNVPAGYALIINDGVYAVADMNAVLKEGGNLVLAADINMEVAETGFTVPKDKSVKIDLNGHNITATSTSAESVQLFSVSGNLEIVGNGTISLASDSFGWSTSYRYTAINIRETGVVTLGEGVNVVCEAEKDGAYGMSYAVDIYTSGTLNVNGASLHSNYIAVRCFYGASVVNVNSGSITSSRNNWGIWKQSADNAKITIADGITYTTDEHGIYIFG